MKNIYLCMANKNDFLNLKENLLINAEKKGFILKYKGADNFELKGKIVGRNSFNPIFFGTILNTEKTIVIKGRFGISNSIKGIFNIIFSLFCLICTMGVVFSENIVERLIFLLIGIVFLFITRILFLFQRKQKKNLLNFLESFLVT